MDSLSVMRRVVAVVALMVWGQAYALIEVQPGSFAYNSVRYATGDEACLAKVAAGAMSIYVYSVSWHYVSGSTPSRSGQCWGSATAGGTPVNANSQFESCPSGFTPNVAAGRCEKTVVECPAGTVPVDGVCVPPTCPEAGEPLGPGGDSVWDTTELTTGVCLNGCAGYGVSAGSGDGQFYVWGPFTSTGLTCTGSGAGSPPNVTPPAVVPPEGPDPTTPGTCPGTVNGAAVQVPCGSTQNTSTGTTTTTTTPPGGGDPVTTTTTETSTTTCSGTQCTTTETTTTTEPDGTTTTMEETTKEPEEKDSFCKQNPNLSICKTSSISGSCGAITCDGDAVQCAMAREQAKRNCEALDEAPGSHPAVLAANDQDTPSGHPLNPAQLGQPINIGGGFDQTDLIGGACPADQSFVVASGFPSVSIPFSKLCSPAEMLGNVLVGITALACLGIALGTKGS